MNPALYCVGLDHKSAPLTVRERCAIAPERIAGVLNRLSSTADHAVVLATCGRIEAYLATCRSPAELHRIFADAVQVPLSDLRGHLRVLRGQEVVRHLLRVAAGLESQIIGEDHIQAQVRRAFQTAQKVGTSGAVLSALGRAAICTGRRVRHETAINCIPLSFARLAVQNLFQAVNSTSLSNILIIGSGVMARDVAKALRQTHQGVEIAVVARDRRRAGLLADQIGASAFGLPELYDLIARTDALFACTSSATFLVTSGSLPVRERPLYVFDLGLPRNIEPSVAFSPHVRLQHLDDIGPAIGTQAPMVDEASAIVEQEVQRFASWHKARQAAPLLARLDRLISALEPAGALSLRRMLHAQIVQFKSGAMR